MKKILYIPVLTMFVAASVEAQGLVSFSNTSTTKITTNAIVAGPSAGLTYAISPQYRFALFCSTNATSVNGQSASIAGNTNQNYAFNDTNWTVVAYGTNFFTFGQFVSASANASGATPVPGTSGGTAAHFVVVGWLRSLGDSVTSVKSWFNAGSPVIPGWIGQSSVSGSITLGTSTAATLFGTSSPNIPGFILGLITPPVNSSPVITTQPTSTSVILGATATFTVGAYSTPSPAYQWLFNSNTIPGATGTTLTINNAQATNAGYYSVVITNIVGSTNSFSALLTVTPSTAPGYILFENPNVTLDKIFTNSAVDGPATGLTAPVGWQYFYALFSSTNATSVHGQTAAMLGADSTNYAFGDSNWTLVTYGTNQWKGMIISAAPTKGELNVVPGGTAGSTAQFVVVGWSANVGIDIATVQSWFNAGNPASDGWIGQSAVTGPLELGSGTGAIPTTSVFGTNAPYVQGFTLGLASPSSSESYALPSVTPALVKTLIAANLVQLSWPAASGTFRVQTAPSLAGPWSDSNLQPILTGTNSVVVVTNSYPSQYYRLAAE